MSGEQKSECTEICAVHAPGCDGLCDHGVTEAHRNACMSTVGKTCTFSYLIGDLVVETAQDHLEQGVTRWWARLELDPEVWESAPTEDGALGAMVRTLTELSEQGKLPKPKPDRRGLELRSRVVRKIRGFHNIRAVQGLKLEGLSVKELEDLWIWLQGMDSKITSLQRDAREPWRRGRI